jgi:hypothetical protein
MSENQKIKTGSLLRIRAACTILRMWSAVGLSRSSSWLDDLTRWFCQKDFRERKKTSCFHLETSSWVNTFEEIFPKFPLGWRFFLSIWCGEGERPYKFLNGYITLARKKREREKKGIDETFRFPGTRPKLCAVEFNINKRFFPIRRSFGYLLLLLLLPPKKIAETEKLGGVMRWLRIHRQSLS